MSTSTAVANAELAKVLRDNEDYVLSVTKSKAVDLSEKMFTSCLISDSMMDQFSSLDHSRVEPQLQLRYLLRLVNQRIQQDESVGDRFLGLLKSWGEQSLSEYLKRNSSREEQPKAKRIRLDDYLCSDDISWILEVLVKANYQWDDLAIALSFRNDQRQAINGANNTDKLKTVLDVWLSGDSTKPPTVNTLTDALRSELMGRGKLALELEERYKARITANKASNIETRSSSNLSLKIVRQSPHRVEVEDGKSAILIAQASVRENVSYHWNKNGQALADNISSDVTDQTCYSGVHEDMLFINRAHQGTQGEYTCCVSNEERQVVSNKVTLTILYTPEKKVLLDKYSSVNTQVPLDEAWPPVGAETFIRLVLIESSRKVTGSSVYSVERYPDKMIVQNKDIEYRDAFSTYRSASFLLIEGRPGSGKTTLVCKLIKDWVEGIVLAQAKLVVLVSLRTLNDDHLQNNTLYEILQPFFSSGATLDNLISVLERNNGESVCFVFDGLDEYHPNRVDESVVFRILHRRYLSQAMIIVSSRPGAMARLRQEVVTQHIEVLGFTQNQILEYIDKFPFDSSLEPSQLKEYLRLHPNVLHMCHLPIHAAIICFVYNMKRGQLPCTQTKIYEEFTKSMILRHLRRNKIEVEIHSLKELPDDVREHFSRLCLLAFDMTVELKQVINSNEITFLLSRDTSLHGDWSLGLVTCNRTAQLSGVSTSYMFLHLTLQEFLAAYYITSAEEERKCQLIQRLSYRNVWTFCFGLETFWSQEELIIYCEMLKPCEDTMVSPIIYAFESQQSLVCDEVMRLSEGEIIIPDMIPSHVPAVKFIISSTTQAIRKIELLRGRLDPGTELLDELLEYIRQVKFPALESLYLDYVSDKALRNVSKILESCKDLTCLELGLNVLTNEVGEILVESMKKLNQLVCLNLSSSSVSIGQSPGILIVIKQIHRLTQLKILGLSGWGIDLLCCNILSSNLYHLLSIEQLDLMGNNISSEGTHCLASALFLLTELERLNLGENKIGSEGAIYLVSALQYCTKLQYLNLTSNNIGPSGAISLASALRHLSRLEWLYLSNNTICSNGAISLASALCHLTRLESLDLSNNTIGSKGAISLAFALQNLTRLESLDLSCSEICSKGVTKLASSLHHLTKLEKLFLNCNSIGSEGAISLVSALHHLSKLECLYLESNNIGSDAVLSFTSALYHLTELKHFSLSGNDIDADSAILIITAMKNCQKLTQVKLNKKVIDKVYLGNNFYLQGLVTSDDSATIDSLVSAVKLHKRDINIHLGFKTINVGHLTVVI